MKKTAYVWLEFSVLLIIAFCTVCCMSGASKPFPKREKVAIAETFMFDDFSYANVTGLEFNGWKVRTEKGWPGIPGALWKTENVSFPTDPENSGNKFMRISSIIGPEVSQTQVCHARKYLEGTYAARVRFTADPLPGAGAVQQISAGDEVVESFYAITPYDKPLDPAYSEMDFEYLPWGGWSLSPGTLMNTTWDTVQIEPWLAKNESSRSIADYRGWHTLVIQAANGVVKYFIDNVLLANHSQPNYPDSPMSINFNLWFIDNKNPLPAEDRTYIEEIDWVFHAKDVVMEPQDVALQVESLRTAHVVFKDNVPPLNPTLDCPCNM
jgi:hypothetical protein